MEFYNDFSGNWTLCDSCEDQAVAADQQVDRGRQVPEQKSGGWLSRLRT
ncbi:hypothetical protein ACIA74_41140 [Streptomyces sp. NPDC051658]